MDALVQYTGFVNIYTQTDYTRVHRPVSTKAVLSCTYKKKIYWLARPTVLTEYTRFPILNLSEV
jgi:hypothetical protein